MRAPDRCRASFGQTEMLDLAFGDEVPHRTGNILDRHRRIDPVLIEQVEAIDPQPPKRILRDLADACGRRVQATHRRRGRWVEPEAELARDHHLTPTRG